MAVFPEWLPARVELDVREQFHLLERNVAVEVRARARNSHARKREGIFYAVSSLLLFRPGGEPGSIVRAPGFATHGKNHERANGGERKGAIRHRPIWNEDLIAAKYTAGRRLRLFRIVSTCVLTGFFRHD